MRKFSICIGLLLAGVGIFSSCNEELGNYSYQEINTINISDIQASYRVGSLDTLVIVPKLTFSLGEEQDTYSYKWVCYHLPPNVQNHETPVLWSEERNLRFPMTGEWARATGNTDYTCFFQVTNTITGVTYTSRKFTVAVRNAYAIGYLALCEKPSGFDIDMIATDEQMEFFPNLLSSLGSALPRSGVTPIDIFTYWDIMSPQRYAPERLGVCILTNRYTTRVHPADYSYRPEYHLSDLILNPDETTDDFVAEKMVVRSGRNGNAAPNAVGLNPRIHVYANRNWYYYEVPIGVGDKWYFFEEPINKKAGQPATATYQAAPYIAASDVAAILYNETDKTFMSQLYDYANPQVILSTTPFKDNANNFMLFLDDMDCVGADRTVVYMSDNFAIIKDNSNNFRYVSFELNTSGGDKGKPRTFKRGKIRSACPDLNAVKHWFVYQNYLFYATETNVYAQYLVDLVSNPIKNLDHEINLTSAVINDANYTAISLLKVVDRGTSSSLICAGTYSLSAPVGQNGRLQIFNFDATEGVLSLATRRENTPIATWTGLGKIVGLSYKER